MTERGCQACGAGERPGANFCSRCGLPSGSAYIALGQLETARPKTSNRPSLRKALAPLALVGLVGLGALVIFGRGAEGGPVVQRVEREAATQPAPVPTAPPPPTTTPAPTPPPPPTPVPDQTPVQLMAVDPATLPPTTATHLAVATGSAVYFLDLAEGAWTTVDTGRRLSIRGGAVDGASNGLDAFGEGVLVQAEPNGRLLYVTPDGQSEAITTGTGARLMGIRDGLVFVEDATTFAPDVRIVAIGVDGEVAYDLTLPPRAWAAGLTRGGQVVVQAGTRVYLAERDKPTVLARGVVLAVADNSILMYDCDEALSCVTQVVDTRTGVVSIVDLPTGSLEPLPDGDFQLRFGLSGRQRYRLTDGQFVKVDQAQAGPARSMGSAQDVSGVWASVAVNALSFSDSDGSALATIPFDVGPCCGAFGVAFLTLQQ